MKNIQKKVKAGNKILYSKTTHQIAEPQQNQEVQRFLFRNCQRQDFSVANDGRRVNQGMKKATGWVGASLWLS